MAPKSQIRFELRAGGIPPENMEVRRVSGREALSSPYRVDVELVPTRGVPLSTADLLGAEASLVLRRPDGSGRFVHGIVWVVELSGVAAGTPIYRVRIVPSLERLACLTRTRVFQAQSVPDIVADVLGEGRVTHRAALTASHPAREYCVQYRETDLHFVSRLLEEEGIAYFFEHAEHEHVLVLSDDLRACSPISGQAAVPYRGDARRGSSDAEEHIRALRFAAARCTAKASLRGFDFERPALLVEGAQAADGGNGAEEYRYLSAVHASPDAQRRATLRLEGLRAPADVQRGASTCARMMPGATFTVAEHPRDELNRELLVVEVEHRGAQVSSAGDAAPIAREYENDFTAHPADVPWRPACRHRRPCAYAETATVVGPAGEEVHVDAHGRVKVQFHWDREGKRDDRSSCWMRVGQPWAGPGFGSLYVPRVGQEVLVRFLEGDPDQPVVLGAVYNGAHPPPASLPGEKTRSTLRSDSSPSGGGSNELRMEDSAGAEEVYLHADKDETIEVRNDKRQEVGASERREVRGDRSKEVRGNQRLEIGGADVSRIGGDSALTVAGSRDTSVLGSQGETVGGGQTVGVAGARMVTAGETSTETVIGAAALTVGAAYAVTVAGAINEAVGLAKAVQVGAASMQRVVGAREERAGGDGSYTVGGDIKAEVRGTLSCSSKADHADEIGAKAAIQVEKGVALTAPKIALEGDALKLIVNGKVALAIDKSGAVTMGASAFVVDGSEVKLKGSTVQKTAAAPASSDSAQVASLQPGNDPRAAVQFVMKNASGKPVANVHYKLELPDGTVVRGTTDGAGNVAVSSGKPGKVKLTFPGLAAGAVKKA